MLCILYLSHLANCIFLVEVVWSQIPLPLCSFLSHCVGQEVKPLCGPSSSPFLLCTFFSMWFCSPFLHVVESISLPSDLTWLSPWPLSASRLWKKMQRMPALSLAPRGHGHVGYLYCSPSFSISWCSLVLNKNRPACWKMRGHMEQSQVSSVVPSGPRKSLPQISKATLMMGSWCDQVPMPSKTTQPSWWLLRREGMIAV